MNKPFLFIAQTTMTSYHDAVLQVQRQPGCTVTMDRDGLIIDPMTPAHTTALLLSIPMLQGIWESVDEV